MDDSQDIVYLETRVHRWKGRWRAMDRVPRMGIVATIFGTIGLLTSFVLKFIPFLSIPFSLVGLLLGAVAFLIGFYQNRRRDGFWFPLAGLILSLLGLAIGIANWSGYVTDQEQKQREAMLAAEAELKAQLTGRWLKEEGDGQQSLEITEAGSLLWSDGSGSGEGTVEETIARYKFKNSLLVISFGADDGGTATMVRYNVDLTQENQLLLSDRRLEAGNLATDMGGRWKRVGPPRKLTAAEQEIADYEAKRDRFRQQYEQLSTTLQEFQTEREELLVRLEPYSNGQERDERWTVWAQDLNTVVTQIRTLEGRLPQLDQAIVVLESAIASLKRQSQLDQAGLDNEQLEDLLLTTERLEEELRSLEVDESVEELVLDRVVEEEQKKKSAGDE
ncbi:MAG: hypothetical protein ACR2NP_21990 [Pirellulaceae bacterium]